MTASVEPTQTRSASPTIAEIARHAGVSVPTVSKVLNGRTDVAPETRRRVEALLREHDYRRVRRPSRSTSTLELVFHELESDWALQIVRGVVSVANEQGLAVVLTDLEGRGSVERDWVDAVRRRQSTGVIAVLADFGEELGAQLRSAGIPLVVVDPTGEPLHDTPSVGASNWSGGLSATRHLLSLGHRRIGVIGGPERILCSRARLDGFRAAMDEVGVGIDPDLVRPGTFHLEAGITQGRRLLGRRDRPTAIFAFNDLQALGVYQAAREARLHIPDDLSVVGFDDLPVATWVGPPLTTIRQPLLEMASVASRLVLGMANGEMPAQPRVELATELVIRESTAAPAA